LQTEPSYGICAQVVLRTGDVMDGMAFLSVRVPEGVRNRVKAVAAERGEKLQDLVGSIIERFLEEAERRPPDLADVLRRLRSIEPSLRSRGVASLWVFGSVARGEARPDSDVDLTLEFAPDANPSLFEIGRIKEEAETVLGRPVDIGERSAMTRRVAAAAERDLVQVF
jgi:predicted nucleotidyltransferase